VATFQSTILAPLDAVRGVGGLLGLRVWQVTVRKRVWTGGRPGLVGTTRTDTDTALVNQAADGSLQPVRVRQVSRREVVVSGGYYTTRDLKVGPITPTFAAEIGLPSGGFDDATVNPVPTGSTTEIIWIVTPPSGTYGYPTAGLTFEPIGQDSTALHVYVFLRSTGRAPT
jgi:hypothetical protein